MLARYEETNKNQEEIDEMMHKISRLESELRFKQETVSQLQDEIRSYKSLSRQGPTTNQHSQDKLMTSNRDNQDLEDCHVFDEEMEDHQITGTSDENVYQTRELQMKTKVCALKSENVSLQNKFESLQSQLQFVEHKKVD